MSTVNMRQMFNLRKVAAFLGVRPLTPFERAARLIQTGDYAKAEAELTALLCAEDSADRAATFNKRGVARVHQGRRQEALSDFEAALEVQPSLAAALVNIGNLLLEEGDIEGAMRKYEAAVRSDDGSRVAHFNLGVALKKLGRHAESVREFRRADRLG